MDLLNQNEHIDKEIGEKFRQVRRMKDFSQEYVANRIGIAQKNYSKLERGESKWTIDRLYAVSEVLGLTVVDILPKSRAGAGHTVPWRRYGSS